jgi:hypothetical protein
VRVNSRYNCTSVDIDAGADADKSRKAATSWYNIVFLSYFVLIVFHFVMSLVLSFGL